MKYEYTLFVPFKIVIRDVDETWPKIAEIVMEHSDKFNFKEDINAVSLKEEGFILRYNGPIE